MAFAFTSRQLADITGGEWIDGNLPAGEFSFVFTDSRNFYHRQGGLFFAIKGERFDGHGFCADLAKVGQQVFVVSKPVSLPQNSFALLVDNTLEALQKLAAAHRKTFAGKVIGITGSNGKTIVKEWLFDLLSPSYNVYKSPKSFNSQIGVALSLLNADKNHDIYLIEAGVSQKGEMQKLAAMIAPDSGVFTHLGEAHSEGFASDKEKFLEKCILFKNVSQVYFHDSISHVADFPYKGEIVQIGTQAKSQYCTMFDDNKLLIKSQNKVWSFETTCKDTISQNNLSLAVAVALDLGVDEKQIARKTARLQAPAMRLELLEGQYNSTLINDTWTNDPDALNHAIDFLLQQKKQKHTSVILSDYPEGAGEEVYQKAADLINAKKIDFFVGIGSVWNNNRQLITATHKVFYPDTDSFLKAINPAEFRDKAVLIKGSRKFELERVAYRLQQKTHQTVLEINLDNLAHNFHLLKSRLQPDTKIMAMVKAFAYGSGNYEVARLLAHHRVDYLAVAYIDEGVELRNAGIKTPVLVLNPELQAIEKFVDFDLEPAIGSFSQLDYFIRAKKPVKIHLELDTGMHRLGFQLFEKEQVCNKLKQADHLTIQGIFTHLAASDEPQKDAQTQQQLAVFKEFSGWLAEQLAVNPILHISNSAGAIRFAEAGGSMVRLGISLYGIDPSGILQNQLKNVFTFKTHITQIKTVQAGEGIGYGFHNAENRGRRIAVIAVGYADGFSRKFSQGQHFVLINGQKAPVTGNICMDMCMVDVSNMDCKEGDTVLLFGENLPVSLWAEKLQTIPYEILTSISQRVRRVFVSEV